MNIRNATKTDIPELLLLSEMMHREGRYSEFNYNPRKMEALIEYLIESGIVVIAEEEKIIGGILALIGEHFFGDDRMSSDIGLYVIPEARKSNIARLLIRAYKKQAKAQDIKDIRIGNTTGPESIGKLYEKEGFIRVGGNYRLEELCVNQQQ